MKIVLFAINGSYSHTNLAIRCLKAPLEREGYEVVLCEYNLRDMTGEMLSRLVAERGDVYGFSCYIWNITEMLSIAADIKGLLPNARIVFGGPEASFATERFDEAPIDFIVCGEGEEAMVKICSSLRDGTPCQRIVQGGKPQVMADEGILYGRDDSCGGTLLYYESSRGCPYSCAYCLSSVTHGVRAKTVEQTLSDMREFERLDREIKVIKFVDRTFNFKPARANEIWRGLLSDEFTKSYHFEICANLLDREGFDILSRFPVGKVQLEIGLQSTNPQTIAAVSRHIDSQRVISAAKRIKERGNIHVHLDLIAGLPYQDMESIRESFDNAYFACDMLQLGFLKLLYGTELRECADEYGIVASSKPPYTVLKTKWLSFEELSRLSRLADVLDRYREGGGFDSCLEYILCDQSSPFDFYDGLCTFIAERDGRSIRKISQNDAYQLLYDYVALNYPEREERFSSLMHEDYARKQVRKAPKFMKK